MCHCTVTSKYASISGRLIRRNVNSLRACRAGSVSTGHGSWVEYIMGRMGHGSYGLSLCAIGLLCVCVCVCCLLVLKLFLVLSNYSASKRKTVNKYLYLWQSIAYSFSAVRRERIKVSPSMMWFFDNFPMFADNIKPWFHVKIKLF